MATSHTLLDAHDHFNLTTFIDPKGRGNPNSLHTTRYRPKGAKKSLWMKNLRVLHGKLWTSHHGRTHVQEVDLMQIQEEHSNETNVLSFHNYFNIFLTTNILHDILVEKRSEVCLMQLLKVFRG